MYKFFVQLRKLLLLPIKFRSTKKKIREAWELRTREELQEKLEEINSDVINAELNSDFKELSLSRTRLELINWILNE